MADEGAAGECLITLRQYEMLSRWKRTVVTPDDYSSIPSVISLMVGVIFFLCVSAKLATKLLMKKRFAADDVTILIATAFGIGMIASVMVASENGLGRRQNSLTDAQLRIIQKGVYATDIIYLCSLFFSKVSMLVILKTLTPVKSHNTILWYIIGALALWTVSSIFASAFQCPVPQTWTVLSDHCFNQRAFWTYYNATNILTELAVLTFPILVLTTLRLPLIKRFALGTIFSLRVVILAPVILELYYRQKVDQVPNDQTFALWPVEVCRQVVQGLSIVFACVPFMKPFFTSLDHGMTRIDDERRLARRTVYVSEKGSGWRTYRVVRSTIESLTRGSQGRGSSEEDLNTSKSESSHQSCAPSGIMRTMTFEVRTEEGSGPGAASGSSRPAHMGYVHTTRHDTQDTQDTAK